VLGAFLSAVVIGFVVGSLARWAVPGPDPMPAWLTIFVGLTGSLVGGGLTAALVGTDTRGDVYAAAMASIGCAALVVIAYRRFVQQRPVTGPEARKMPTRGFGIPQFRRKLERMGIDPNSIGEPGGPRRLPQVEAEQTAELERLENLRKLEDLHRAGLLDDEELREKRERLLDGRA
jgi:uncharacterized membrane protein YeaQ/YmgE (transglycosylase-associated protein family)